MSLPWYEVVSAETPLDQGDILMACPVVGWREGPIDLRAEEEAARRLRDTVEVSETDVIVMTQTCDLAQNKVRYVVLCPHYALSIYREAWEASQRAAGQSPTVKSWTSYIDHIAAGHIWNLSLLNAEDGSDYQMEQPRLHLRPPYREHLSQAFARFFMRVGLSTDIRKDWR